MKKAQMVKMEGNFTSQKQRDEFEKLARPLIKFLNDNFSPHTTIIISPVNAELLTGLCAFTTHDYVRD